MDIEAPATQTEHESTQRMMWEEWLAWAPDSRITEWVDGEVVETMPIGERHDAIFQWLITILQLLLRKHPQGTLRAAPSVLKLTSLPRGREPDLMFIAAEHADRLHDTYVEGPADAVFEIISPESRERDEKQKLGEYQTEGIPEYWLIDPENQQLKLYRIRADERYHPVNPRDGKYESTVIQGFYLRPEWLWSDPLADELETLAELGIL